MRLCQPYGELTRETLAARVCDLAGLPRDLSSEEVDAIDAGSPIVRHF
jgi:hypothetical protein